VRAHAPLTLWDHRKRFFIERMPVGTERVGGEE
jgi:hypothetical protein